MCHAHSQMIMYNWPYLPAVLQIDFMQTTFVWSIILHVLKELYQDKGDDKCLMWFLIVQNTSDAKVHQIFSWKSTWSGCLGVWNNNMLVIGTIGNYVCVHLNDVGQRLCPHQRMSGQSKCYSLISTVSMSAIVCVHVCVCILPQQWHKMLSKCHLIIGLRHIVSF